MSILNITQLDEIFEIFRKYHYDGSQSRRQLGFSLGLFVTTLNKIEEDHPLDSSRQLEEILGAWLRQSDKVEIPTWYALIQALRSIGENAVAISILKEKHSACAILPQHQLQSICDTLFRLMTTDITSAVFILLHKEGLIQGKIPLTSKHLLDQIYEAICRNNHNIAKFADILLKYSSTSEDGYVLQNNYKKLFGMERNQRILDTTTSVSSTTCDLKSCTEFRHMRDQYADAMYDVIKILQKVPPLKDLKRYIQHGYRYKNLIPSLSRCQSNDQVLGFITDRCSLINIKPLDAIVNKFDIAEAKPIIQKYQQDVDEFCSKLSLRFSLNEVLSAHSGLLSETVTIKVNRNVDDCTLDDVRDLIEKAFENQSHEVIVIIVRKTESFTVTCSFPLTLSPSLIASAHNNLKLLIKEGVYHLTIGYYTVYTSQQEMASEVKVEESLSSVYLSKNGLEQLFVSQSVQLMNKQHDFNDEHIVQMKHFDEEQLTLNEFENKQLKSDETEVVSKRKTVDSMCSYGSKKFELSREQTEETLPDEQEICKTQNQQAEAREFSKKEPLVTKHCSKKNIQDLLKTHEKLMLQENSTKHQSLIKAKEKELKEIEAHRRVLSWQLAAEKQQKEINELKKEEKLKKEKFELLANPQEIFALKKWKLREEQLKENSKLECEKISEKDELRKYETDKTTHVIIETEKMKTEAVKRIESKRLDVAASADERRMNLYLTITNALKDNYENLDKEERKWLDGILLKSSVFENQGANALNQFEMNRPKTLQLTSSEHNVAGSFPPVSSKEQNASVEYAKLQIDLKSNYIIDEMFLRVQRVENLEILRLEGLNQRDEKIVQLLKRMISQGNFEIKFLALLSQDLTEPLLHLKGLQELANIYLKSGKDEHLESDKD